MEFYKAKENRSGVQTILQTIKDYGPISKREIQETTGLCWGHVSQVTKRFLGEGYIVVSENEMTAGRTRELLDINREDNYFIGADLNSERIRAVVTDMKGTVKTEVRKNWERNERESVLETIFEVLDGMIAQYPGKRMIGIGFAVQGVVDTFQGVSLCISRIKNWIDVPLKQIIEERYHVDVIVAHDPDCLMKSESECGILKGSSVSDVVLIHYSYGVGIGMSIMINGQIYLGYQGKAGEISNTILNVHEDGWHDYLGHYIAKRDTEIDMNVLGEYIGRSVAIVNSLFNPEMIVLHMAEPDYQEEIYDAVEFYLRNHSYNTMVGLSLSKLNRNKNAKALGAVWILIDREIDRVL